MSIIEAIRHAETEHAVYFLLTTYIESLWIGDSVQGLLGTLRRLPITSQSDVQERAKVLMLEQPGPEGEIIAEAAEVFRVASQRLGTDTSTPSPRV